MMRLRFNKRAFNNIVEKNAASKLDDVGKLLVEQLQRTLEEPPARTGRVYDDIVASAPGEPPARRTGELQQSIKYEVNAKEGYVDVGSDLKYAPMLEYGTSRMAPRPWLKVTFEENMDEIAKRFGGRWEQ